MPLSTIGTVTYAIFHHWEKRVHYNDHLFLYLGLVHHYGHTAY